MTDEREPKATPDPEEVFAIVEALTERTRKQSRRVAVSTAISALLAVLVLVMVVTVANLSGVLDRRSAVLDCVGKYQHALALVIDAAIRDDATALGDANTALLSIECTANQAKESP